MLKKKVIFTAGIIVNMWLLACGIKVTCQEETKLGRMTELYAEENNNNESMQAREVQEIVSLSVTTQQKQVQYQDGYIYGYWGNALRKYNMETLEEELLYELPSSLKAGLFCKEKDYIYFLEKEKYAVSDHKTTKLCRMKCDGTEFQILIDHIPDDSEYYLPYGYRIDIFQNVIYLTGYYNNFCYKLEKDGGVTEISNAETLYGLLPEGCALSKNADIPSLPYAMQNYGCLFVENEKKELVRVQPDNREIESTGVSTEAEFLFAKGIVYYCTDLQNEGEWYCIDLEDILDHQLWAHMNCKAVAYDEEGIYFAGNTEEEIEIYKLDWKGSLIQELRFNIGKEAQESRIINFFDKLTDATVKNLKWEDLLRYGFDDVQIVEGYAYYCDNVGNGMGVKRVSLEEGAVPEPVNIYCGNESSNILSDVEYSNFEYISKGQLLETRINELYLDASIGNSKKINEQLKKIYQEIFGLRENSIEEYRDFYGENEEVVVPTESNCIFTAETNVDYMDSEYISISVNGYECWYYEQVHSRPACWTDNYVFHRVSGERMSVAEVTGLTESEVIELVTEYAEDEYTFTAESILEQRRFFLTENGFGIHYDPEEIESFAAGSIEIMIPRDF